MILVIVTFVGQIWKYLVAPDQHHDIDGPPVVRWLAA